MTITHHGLGRMLTHRPTLRRINGQCPTGPGCILRAHPVQGFGTTACFDDAVSRTAENFTQGDASGELVINDKDGWLCRHSSEILLCSQ